MRGLTFEIRTDFKRAAPKVRPQPIPAVKAGEVASLRERVFPRRKASVFGRARALYRSRGLLGSR